MGFLCIKAELYKITFCLKGIDRASHTKRGCLKEDFLSLQALQVASCKEENLVLFFRGLHSGRVSPVEILHSTPTTFSTTLVLNKVYLPLTHIEGRVSLVEILHSTTVVLNLNEVYLPLE